MLCPWRLSRGQNEVLEGVNSQDPDSAQAYTNVWASVSDIEKKV